MFINKIINRFFKIIKSRFLGEIFLDNERVKLLNGRILSNQIKNNKIRKLSDSEFSVFSQFGDDGIIQWLVQNLDIPNKTFIEFGVEDFSESNSRFLMMNDNWSGFVMDGSSNNISKLKSQHYYWKYDLNSKAIFINKDNINDLIDGCGFHKDVGLLHIDLDGNDYYIWDAINTIEPIIVIVEYNSIFGKNRPISVIYDDNFIRGDAHYSNLLFGSSLKSLYQLAEDKGYSFIGCNSAGNNAYFVKNEKINSTVKAIELENGFVSSKFRESRSQNYELTLLDKVQARQMLKDIEVYNTETNLIERF
jgi:hypothetical protein